MRLENNWKYKSLENLEKEIWPVSENNSRLTQEMTRLRKLPLSDFSVENLRILIGQEMALKYLIPLATEQLSKNLFVEGDLYEGDLLQVVLKITPAFWAEHKHYWIKVHELIENRLSELEDHKINAALFNSIVFSTIK